MDSWSKIADNYDMKRISAFLLAFCAAAFVIPQYAKAQSTDVFRQEGIASWYGPEFDGRATASGEIFNSTFFTAAHPTLPFGTMLLVTNQHNNRQVTVKVNDRGPFVSARILDISKAAAEQLDMLVTGTAPVRVESIERIVMPSAGRAPEADPYWTVPASPPVSAQVPSVVPAPAYPPAPAYVPSQMPASSPAYPVPQETPPAKTYVPSPAYGPAAGTPPGAAAQPAASVPAAAMPPVSPAAPLVRATLTPAITPSPEKTYRLQVGSYKIARNAVESFEKLKTAGLNPAYERNGEYFRVVLAGIRGSVVQSITEKLGSAGFREALIREER